MVTVLDPYKPYKLGVLERGDLYFPDGKRIKPRKARAWDPKREEWRFMVVLKPKPWWIPQAFLDHYLDRFGRYMIVMVPPKSWRPATPAPIKRGESSRSRKSRDKNENGG